MKITDRDIAHLIEKAAQIIAPLWPMQNLIARNPLHYLEPLDFEEAVSLGQTFLASHRKRPHWVCEVNREMIKWCQAFLDEGQAAIPMPEREKGFYCAWKLLAPFDRKLKAFKKNRWLLSLPSQAEQAILFCLDKLGISDAEAQKYLTYSLGELPGWAGYIKWRSDWQNEKTEKIYPISLIDFLAVRLVLSCAIGEGEKELFPSDDPKPMDLEFFTQLKRREEAYSSDLVSSILGEAAKLREAPPSSCRADAQIVFCIDVRSEPLRMRIEQMGRYETLGFAGFFSLPISIQNYNTGQTKHCCPVLLKPLHTVLQEPAEEAKKRLCHHERGKTFLQLCGKVYRRLKYQFASPFALAETLGPWCGLWMGLRTLWPRQSVQWKKALQEAIKPTLATAPKIDIALFDQITYAQSALTVMGLTKNFSPLVVLCGHKSQTENNPYASALDCGACGANHGGPNGKILAAILNSYDVRSALAQKGIFIPDDTLFIGAEHNTTTDEVVFEEDARLSDVHQKILQKLKSDCIQAGISNSQSRCKTFGLSESIKEPRKHVLKRSSDWSEVRPEWGLARNAAFIAGPRSLTKNLNLDGRCFLHSYEWKDDEEGKSLETILTAPLVVAEWINTQYFFSALHNAAYGSGSKITHNITGKTGVMQGNGSDLMHGLPLQSVNLSDEVPYHEPIRLQAVVYAPRSKVEAIVEKHPILQRLVFNRWIVLTAIDPVEAKAYRIY